MDFGSLGRWGGCEHNGAGLAEISKISVAQHDIFQWDDIVFQTSQMLILETRRVDPCLTGWIRALDVMKCLEISYITSSQYNHYHKIMYQVPVQVQTSLF